MNSSYISPNSKTIYIFKNGDFNYPGKRFTIATEVRSWHHFLKRISSAVQSKAPIRELCSAYSGIINAKPRTRKNRRKEKTSPCVKNKQNDTPFKCEKVVSFADLKNNGKYVGLMDGETLLYKNGGYKTSSERAEHQRRPTVLLTNLGNLRNSPCNTVIYVFLNGMDQSIAMKFVLTKDDMQHWDRMLHHIGKRLDIKYGDCRGLYSINGKLVQGPFQLQDGAFYVAVGYHEKFMFLEYLHIYKKYPKYLQRMRIEDSVKGLKSFTFFKDNGVQNTKNYAATPSTAEIQSVYEMKKGQALSSQSASIDTDSTTDCTDTENESKSLDSSSDDEQIGAPLPSAESIMQYYINNIDPIKDGYTSMQRLPMRPLPYDIKEINPYVEKKISDKSTNTDAWHYGGMRDYNMELVK